MKTNYKVVYSDYVQNEIIETSEAVNKSEDIYSRFLEAKQTLIGYLCSERDQINERILEIRNLKK